MVPHLRHLHPRLGTLVMQNIMRGPLIRDPRTRLRRHSRGLCTFRRRDRNCSSDKRRREAGRLVTHSRCTVRLFGVVVVVALVASGDGRFDEFAGERTEEGPDGRDGHCDEDEPFFDFAP